MTSPAVNISEITSQLATGFYRSENPLGVPTSGNLAWSGTIKQTTLIRTRPESQSHPVREDGTRAPGAWNHRWFYEAQRFGRCEYYYRQGGVGSRYRRQWSDDCGMAQMSPLYYSPFWAAPQGVGSASFPFGVEQAARTRVLSNIRDADFMLGVTLAEAGKTVSLLRHTAESILDGITSFRRLARMSRRDFIRFMREVRSGGKPRHFVYQPLKSRKRGPWDHLLKSERTMSRKIPEKWLEYTYGWKPLIMDIDNAGAALAALVFDKNQPLYLIARGGHEDINDVDVDIPLFRNVGALVERLTLRVTSGCHYSIRYEKPGGMLADARDQLGLGLASTLWELTPYSFALDWVVGVGDWINSMGAADVADFVEGSVSKIQRVNLIRRQFVIPPGSIAEDAQVVSDPGGRVVAFGRFSREVLTHLPVPAILPQIRNRMGLPQLASLMSLLVQSGAKPYNRT